MNARAVKMNGRTIRVADDQPSFWRRVEAGLWEPDTLAFLDRTLGPAATFLDIGAWVGPLTLYAAFRARRVIAVEADPVAFDQLRRNLAANPALASRVEPLARAVHPVAGPVRLGARRKPGDSMSSALLGEGEHSWEVEAITPAELAAMIPADGPLVIKIDIEGGEYALLPHLGPVLDRAAAVHLSLHPASLREALPDDSDAVAAINRAALEPLRDFEGAPAPALVAAGDWSLIRRAPAPFPPRRQRP